MAQVFINSFRKYAIAIADVFNEIIVQEGKSPNIKENKVPIRFSTDEKMISHIRSTSADKAKRINLPAIGYNITTIDPDEERYKQPLNKIIAGDYESGDTDMEFVFQPQPYNFTWELGVYTKYAADMFVILEQILPRFKKAQIIPIDLIKFTNGETWKEKVPLVLDSTNLDFTTEDIGQEDERILKTTLTLTLQGHIFFPIKSHKFIQQIDIDFEEEQGEVFGSISLP